MKAKRRIVILGGGLAGLSAAYTLSQNPQNEVLVLEKEKQLGGLAKTVEYKKYLFEFGPHRFWTKNKEVEKLVKKLLGRDLLKVPRFTRIYFNGQFFGYPPKFSDTLKLGYFTAFRIFSDYLLVRARSHFKKTRIKTLEDAYIDQFGKSLYKTFFEKYSEKIWGVPCRKISADWALQRTRRMSISKVLKEMIFKKKEVVSLVDWFYFPKKGVGQISEKLALEIKKNGGQIWTETEVQEVRKKGQKIESVLVSNNHKTKRIKADFFISTLPLPTVIKLLSPKAPKEVERVNQKLKYRDLILVNFIVNKKSFSPDHWIYTQDEGIFNRVIQPKNFSSLMVPDKNKTSIVCEWTVGESEQLEDGPLIEKTTQALVEKLGFFKKREILESFVMRASAAYPIYDLNYVRNVQMVKNYLKKFSNFQTTGRAGLFRYNNMDHSILSGLFAARNLQGGNFDLDKINLEKEYLEEKKKNSKKKFS